MYRRFLVFLSSLFLLAGCAQPYAARCTPTTSWLTVTAPPGDRAGRDVTEAIETQREAICQALEVECTFPVQVEIFASQADFDAHVMNRDSRGFYAISGQGKIQMVTPSTAPAGRDIPYEERVQIAVHEFVHLALDQIDPDLPDWIDEGTAVYLGPHDLYDQALRQGIPAEMLPGLRDLVEVYDSVPAADLFAYTLVRFIVARGGLERLNALLRSAAEREQYIEPEQAVEWQRFLEQAYPAASSPAPVFAPRPCWSSIPAALNAEVSAVCGTVAVPENRGLPFSQENTVQLAVMILQAPAVETTQAPVFLLGGGPGQDMISLYDGFLQDLELLRKTETLPEDFPGRQQDLRNYQAVLEQMVAGLKHRATIIIDQRGCGYSQPSLKCQGQDPTDCRARLVDEGVNLPAYNTLENAADIDAVRRALGYVQINLLGGSYGTRLGLEVMRQSPGTVRAVVLDGVAPPQVDWGVEMVRRYDDALRVIFHHCRADPACDAAYPDLETIFYEQVARLDQSPVEVQAGGQSLVLDGGALRETVWNGMFDQDKIRFLPLLIHQVAAGDYSTWSLMQAGAAAGSGTARSAAAGGSMAWGMHYSVECAERWAFQDPRDLVAASAGLPAEIREGVVDQFAITFDICEEWDVPTAPALIHTAVESDIPTLLLSGEFDPGTPPAFAQMTAETLSRSYSLVMPYRGHTDGFFNPCQQQITGAFWDHPEVAPDASCIEGLELPGFWVEASSPR